MNRRTLVLASTLLATTAAPTMTAQSGSGHTKLPVGNYRRGSLLPTGQFITPTAAPGSTIQVLETGLREDGNADAAQAVRTAFSPDGTTLLVLTSGWNRSNFQPDGTPITYPTLDPVTGAQVGTTGNAEWVFVFGIASNGTLVKRQQINVPSTFNGLAWAPDGSGFYVSGGNHDRVYVYRFDGTEFVPSTPFILLGHDSNQTAPIPRPDGGILKGTRAAEAAPAIVVGAMTAGVALSRDGQTLVAANFENDSVSIVDTESRSVTREVRFFSPGDGVAQGEFPYDVVVVSDADGAAQTAYVTSQRDDEVMVVDIASGAFSSIPVGGQPNRLLLSNDEKTLYVVNGIDDTISVIDTSSQTVVNTISLSRPWDRFKGANPDAAALSADGKTLFVTLGFENAVAVVDVSSGRVTGRIPTGWYPTSVSVRGRQHRPRDAAAAAENRGRETLYVTTFKSNSGPNRFNTGSNPAFLAQRSYPLEKAQLNIIPVPEARALEMLTEQVDDNNGLRNRRPNPTMVALQQKIDHVVYIVKENKTYDQVLGDLPRGNGDPSLTEYPQDVSPNHHDLAMTFGLLDNFYATGEVSGTGWNWSTYASATDYNEKTIAVNYGNGGLSYDAEGTNRIIGVGLPRSSDEGTPFTERLTAILDPTGSSDILPGTKDVNAPAGAHDLDADALGGYLWDSALRAGKTVRNYGFFVDQAYYVNSGGDPTMPDPNFPTYIPISPTPFDANLPQGVAVAPELLDKTDIYYRGFDQNNADTYLYNEWSRDVAENGLAQLTLIRLPHDHFGSMGTALAGLRTATLQMSDNDYALGKIIENISLSPYWQSTAIFVLEDDAQSGSDHIDSHRSFVYVISPYSRRGVTISTNYNTVNVLRTMEDLLGIEHLNVSDANAAPMAHVFTLNPDFTPYTASIPGDLCAPPVDPGLVPDCANAGVKRSAAVRQLHDAAWWAARTSAFDFTAADRVDADAFNRVLWEGIMGENVPYPVVRSGRDLRQHRAALLKRWKQNRTN